MKNLQHCFKVPIIGDVVGKTSILTRFIKNHFEMFTRSTHGANFELAMLELNGMEIYLQMWDIAENIAEGSLFSIFMKNADGIIIVFDVANAESFHSLAYWINLVENEGLDKKPAIIVGNKSDLKFTRNISFEEAGNFAERNGAIYIEVSALTGHNVKELFRVLTADLISVLD